MAGLRGTRPGQYRHPITIQSMTLTPDGMGSKRESWSTYVTDRAAIWPVSAKQVIQNAALEQEITHRVRMRFRSGITNDMQILFGSDSRTLKINTVINIDEMSRELDLLCTEIS